MIFKETYETAFGKQKNFCFKFNNYVYTVGDYRVGRILKSRYYSSVSNYRDYKKEEWRVRDVDSKYLEKLVRFIFRGKRE